MGIEPTYSAWEADVLPLNYTRKVIVVVILNPAGDPGPVRILESVRASVPLDLPPSE